MSGIELEDKKALRIHFARLCGTWCSCFVAARVALREAGAIPPLLSLLLPGREDDEKLAAVEHLHAVIEAEPSSKEQVLKAGGVQTIVAIARWSKRPPLLIFALIGVACE